MSNLVPIVLGSMISLKEVIVCSFNNCALLVLVEIVEGMQGIMRKELTIKQLMTSNAVAATFDLREPCEWVNEDGATCYVLRHGCKLKCTVRRKAGKT